MSNDCFFLGKNFTLSLPIYYTMVFNVLDMSYWFETFSLRWDAWISIQVKNCWTWLQVMLPNWPKEIILTKSGYWGVEVGANPFAFICICLYNLFLMKLLCGCCHSFWELSLSFAWYLLLIVNGEKRDAEASPIFDQGVSVYVGVKGCSFLES